MAERRGLRWGILGCGNIAGKFARDLAAHGIPVSAAASRDAAKAGAFAREHGIPGAHGEYEALLGDPRVDAIYIALPNHLHADWSVRAARAGKHVLCEKPASLYADETRIMVDAARKAGVFFMEGFMYRLHPQWGLVRALIDEGAIGPVRRLEAVFSFDLGHRPGNIRLSPEAWGGALSDIGCYGLHFARSFGDGTPRVAKAESRLGPEGVDEWTEAVLEFPGGAVAAFACGIRSARPSLAVIEGADGRIEIPQPWHGPAQGAEVRVENGEGTSVYTAGDGLAAFAREAREVEEHAAAGQSPSLPWDDAIAQAELMEEIRGKAGLGYGSGVRG